MAAPAAPNLTHPLRAAGMCVGGRAEARPVSRRPGRHYGRDTAPEAPAGAASADSVVHARCVLSKLWHGERGSCDAVCGPFPAHAAVLRP